MAAPPTADFPTAADEGLYTEITPVTLGRLRVLRVADVHLDLDGHQLRVGAHQVPLALKEFQLLATLMGNAGRVLSRRELLDAGWGPAYADHNKTLDVHVLRLRRKLNPLGGPARIRTVRGLGYVFDLQPW